MTALLPRLFRAKPGFSRKATRHACRIDGELLLVDSGVIFPGRLLDISSGGAMFRPRLAYLQNRRDIPARLKLGDDLVECTIMSTGPAGFGLSFAQPLGDEAIHRILMEISICDV